MKRAIVPVVALAMVAALLGGCTLVNPCTSTAERSASFPAGDTTTVRILAEAGSLEVVGLTGITRVTASGTACAGNDHDLETIQFAMRTTGTEIIIEALTPASGTSFDVRVEVPDTFQVEINDGSGDIVVQHVAGVRLNDGSGDVKVEYVTGDVVVENDGSGGISLLYVDAGVEIISDGTGDIDVAHVGADVIVGSDGSGNIAVSDIEGDFHVEQDGSGSISAIDIAGDFVVESDGSGSIRSSGIGGKISIPGD